MSKLYESTTIIETTDTYEVAFYMMYESTLEQVEIRTVRENKQKKKGLKRVFVFTVSDVPLWAIQSWRNDEVFGNLTAYARMRRKLKEKMLRERIRKHLI